MTSTLTTETVSTIRAIEGVEVARVEHEHQTWTARKGSTEVAFGPAIVEQAGDEPDGFDFSTYEVDDERETRDNLGQDWVQTEAELIARVREILG